jgi:DNA-binding response OmpR family regulator
MAPKKSRKRILVVNDTEEILELFQIIIEGMGHEMLPMTYAPDDLARIVEVDPDLVIVDFVMGGDEFRGWQLVQKLKMNRDTERLPIIICTGAKREIHEYEGWLTEKGIAVVLKPFSIDDLEKAIDKVLRNPDFGVRDRADGAAT